MSRKNLPVVLVAACFVIAFAASVLAAQAPALAVQPDATPIPAPDQASAPGQCLPESLVLPTPLLLAGTQTCEVCLADCDDRQTRCFDHCTGRNCIMKCYGQYLTCTSKCLC